MSNTLTLAIIIGVATAFLTITRYLTLGRATTRFEARMSELKHDIESQWDLKSSTRMLGLTDVANSIRDFDYGEHFRHAKELTLLMNDGSRWFDTNREWMIARQRECDGCETQVILVHPKSEYVDILARKSQVSSDEMRHKILANVRRMRRELDPSVTIIGHFLYSSYSLVISEDLAVYVPYLTSRTRGDVPALVFRRDAQGFFDVLSRDLEALRVDCRPIFESEAAFESSDDDSMQSRDFVWSLKGTERGVLP